MFGHPKMWMSTPPMKLKTALRIWHRFPCRLAPAPLGYELPGLGPNPGPFFHFSDGPQFSVSIRLALPINMTLFGFIVAGGALLDRAGPCNIVHQLGVWGYV